MIELHRTPEAVDDEMLKCTTGIKFYTHKGYQKIAGPTAKYCSCKTPGYAYPLFKTHKLQPDNSKTISISIFSTFLFDFYNPQEILPLPKLLLFSRLLIFQSVSVKFCKSFVNEYCRDSKKISKWQYFIHCCRRC